MIDYGSSSTGELRVRMATLSGAMNLADGAMRLALKSTRLQQTAL